MFITDNLTSMNLFMDTFFSTSLQNTQLDYQWTSSVAKLKKIHEKNKEHEQCHIRPLSPRSKTGGSDSTRTLKEATLLWNERRSSSSSLNKVTVAGTVNVARNAFMDRGKERKKRHLEITREGKQVLALDHVPMQKTVELCQFNLQTPDSTELVDHVVVCHCNLAANGHQVVRYFTERNVSKICFLTETPPKFEVWGDIVTHRPDCQVYFVTGEITDVTVSLFGLT